MTANSKLRALAFAIGLAVLVGTMTYIANCPIHTQEDAKTVLFAVFLGGAVGSTFVLTALWGL